LGRARVAGSGCLVDRGDAVDPGSRGLAGPATLPRPWNMTCYELNVSTWTRRLPVRFGTSLRSDPRGKRLNPFVHVRDGTSRRSRARSAALSDTFGTSRGSNQRLGVRYPVRKCPSGVEWNLRRFQSAPEEALAIVFIRAVRQSEYGDVPNADGTRRVISAPTGGALRQRERCTTRTWPRRASYSPSE
jgi:hypothetical protein